MQIIISKKKQLKNKNNITNIKTNLIIVNIKLIITCRNNNKND